MKNRLRLIWHALQDRPIMSGITFMDIPHLESRDLIIRNCIFPEGTIYTAEGTGEVDWLIERAEGRTIEPKFASCYATGTGEIRGGLQ